MTAEATYLYAVARPLPTSMLADVAGIGGRPVRAVPAGQVTCVVSSVELAEFGEEPLRRNLEDLEWLGRVARQHDAVVSAVGRRCAALPLRMATVYRDDASAAARIEARQDTALAALDRIEGRDEWGVKVFRVPAGEPVTAPPSRPGSGAEYLQRRRGQLDQQATAGRQALEDALGVFDELAGGAVDSRQHRAQDARLSGNPNPMLLNAAFLVERDDEAEFRAAVGRLADEHPPGAIALTGPWPPYSFVEWSEA